LLDGAALPGRTSRSLTAIELASALIAAVHRNEVDVVVLNDVPAEFQAGVVTRGTRIYCADVGADHAFVRSALLFHADQRPFLERTRRVKLEALRR
jgi:hypothetical protein